MKFSYFSKQSSNDSILAKDQASAAIEATKAAIAAAKWAEKLKTFPDVLLAIQETSHGTSDYQLH